nr:MAG TPA: hypothetical protein [Caudoviricetes sp.]
MLYICSNFFSQSGLKSRIFIFSFSLSLYKS